MSLVADTSIPFPSNAPEVWDSLQLRGTSNKLYVWPPRPKYDGLVVVRLKPPKPRKKTSAVAGKKKPRTKDIGDGVTVLGLEFEVTPFGWPTFVDLWRLLAEGRDGPWRSLHPTVDTFDARQFHVTGHVEITDTTGGIVRATCELSELDPDTQAGKGAASGITTPGAKAYTDAAQQNWIDEQVALAQAKIRVNQLATKADLNRKNGERDAEAPQLDHGGHRLTGDLTAVECPGAAHPDRCAEHSADDRQC